MDDASIRSESEDIYKIYLGRVSMLKLATDASLETTYNELAGKFAP